ncbi:transcription initiation factor TFIID subunit 4 [Trichomonascus vanleenenianus]|uniref:Taf4p n=1 Tax=Trichomonascus vanleenenianus TaxID=2268995 RepID=UPI003EC9DA54
MSEVNSSSSSKRPSPPINQNQPAAKRIRQDTDASKPTTPLSGPILPSNGSANAINTTDQASPGPVANSTAAAAAPLNTVDPDQLSDALLSAGVDLKAEENYLSSTLTADQASAKLTPGALHGAPNEFLVLRNLNAMIRKTTAEAGIRYTVDKEQEISQLVSIACQEWLSDIVTTAVMLNRHRRRSRNDVHSEISRALRQIAIKDKESEDRRLAQKAVNGIDSAPEEKKGGSEETQYRNANATALMMTGKKKYSWLTGGSNAASPGRSMGIGGKNEVNIRYREAREEPQLVMRDLLGAIEDRRMGVEKTIVKGYAKLRN